LVSPGPDLVVADEAHKLKNSNSKLYKALNRVATRRRIALTGSPLQNNLIEYFAMVNFVKYMYLGTEAGQLLVPFIKLFHAHNSYAAFLHNFPEFKRRFVYHIQDGEHAESTREQKK
jgi:SNF2 family DNA or RNA helicase